MTVGLSLLELRKRFKKDEFTSEEEYRKNKELKKEDVLAIMDWIAKQSHLPYVPEKWVIFFMHCCYYSLEGTKSALEHFFTIRAFSPEIFTGFNMELAKQILRTHSIVILPGMTPEKYDVMWYKLFDTDPSKFSLTDFYKVQNVLVNVFGNKFGTSPGHSFVLDASGYTAAHLLRINPTVVKKSTMYLQDACPLRLKHCHIINSSPLAEKVLTLFTQFVTNSSLLSLLHVHSTLDTLYKFIPKEYTPADYGGNNPSMADMRDEVIVFLKDNLEFIREDEAKVADESKRMTKSHLADELTSGLQGSFRKLDLD